MDTTPAPALDASSTGTLSSDERAAILDAVRDFAATEFAPHTLEWDAEKHFPRDVLRRAGELGLGGVYVNDDVGGAGLSRADAVAIFEELAYGDPTVTAYITIHNMVAWMIDTYGTAAQRSAGCRPWSPWTTSAPTASPNRGRGRMPPPSPPRRSATATRTC